MKKLLCMLTLAITTLTASAQQQDGLPDGILALEWNFNPFDYESKPVKVAEIRARMFFDAKSALRFGVGVGFDNDTDENSSNLSTQPLDNKNYTITTSSTKTTNNATTLKFTLGYEYHFANTGKLDFYGGLSAGYLGRFYSATYEYGTDVTDVSYSAGSSSSSSVYTYENIDYEKRNAKGDKYNEHGIFGTLFTGVDFYVYKKLYIGAELGITYNMGKTSNGTYTQVNGVRTSQNGSVQAESVTKYSSETGIKVYSSGQKEYSEVKEHTGKYNKIYIEPSIRIGWMF